MEDATVIRLAEIICATIKVVGIWWALAFILTGGITKVFVKDKDKTKES